MQVIISSFFAVAIAVFVAYMLLAVFHALKFRYLSKRTKKITLIYLAVSLITMIAAVILFLSIDWKGF